MSQERRFRLYQVNAFTRSPFSGNPAGVVPTAEGLSESEMQAIARELGNPGSAFVLPADGDDHDVRVRFFTPSTTVPLCTSVASGRGAMGRPGVARVWVDIEGEAPTRVRVGGNAVVVMRGELILPYAR